jgi:arginine/lysine/histidine/glutamine transport system substrate-binding/permease protein
MLYTTRSRLLHRWLFGLCSFLCALLFASCSLDQSNQTAQTNSTPSSPSPTSAPLVLKVAVDPAFAPFEMKQANGSLTGFDIDLINAVGSSSGFLIDFDEMTFDDIIRNLYGGKVDAAISAITINRDRATQVAFSRPYFKSGLALAVPSNANITGLDALRGKRIGVQQGTTSEVKAQTIPEAKISSTASAPQALQALANSQVDAVINDAPVTAYAIKNGFAPGIKIVEPLLTEEFYGIATAKNSKALEKINAGLTAVFNNGTYTQIYKKWFTGEPAKLPDAAPI